MKVLCFTVLLGKCCVLHEFIACGRRAQENTVFPSGTGKGAKNGPSIEMMMEELEPRNPLRFLGVLKTSGEECHYIGRASPVTMGVNL